MPNLTLIAPRRSFFVSEVAIRGTGPPGVSITPFINDWSMRGGLTRAPWEFPPQQGATVPFKDGTLSHVLITVISIVNLPDMIISYLP